MRKSKPRGYKKRLLRRYDDRRGGLTAELTAYLSRLAQLGLDKGAVGMVATELIAATVDREAFEAELAATSPEGYRRVREGARVRVLLNAFEAFLDDDRATAPPYRPFFDRRDPGFIDRVKAELNAYRKYFMLDRERAPIRRAARHRPGEVWLRKHVPRLVAIFSIERGTYRRAIALTREALVAAGHDVTVETVRAVAKTVRREGRHGTR